MKMHGFAPVAARVGGFVAGLTVVAAAVVAWQVPGGTRELGAQVRLVAHPTGEFAVAPIEPVLLGTELHPSAAPAGSHPLRVQNQTGTRLGLQLRAASSGDLDPVLWLEISSGGERVYRGPLGGLRRWSPGEVRLAPGAAAQLDVAAWVPSHVTDGYQARAGTIELELRAIAEEVGA